MAWTGDPVWLADVLREAGLKVIEQDGWRNRGHGDFKDIRGIVCHHTAGGGPNDWRVVQHGRPDLPGPLSQLVLEKDGTYRVICVGVAWHAGRGAWPGWPTNNANWHTIGIEAVSRGLPDNNGRFDWTDAQLDAYIRGCAAIARKVGFGADKIVGHREYSFDGKIDPAGINMNDFRAAVAALLERPEPAPVPPPVPAGEYVPTDAERQLYPLDATGGISHFGGPGDASTRGGRMAITGEPGEAPADDWYCAMRWRYVQWPTYQHRGETWHKPGPRVPGIDKSYLKDRRVLVTNLATGRAVCLRPADAGPRPGKRIIDASTRALEVIGAVTDTQVLVQWTHPGTPLGPVTPDIKETSMTDAARDNQVQLRGPGLQGWEQLGGRTVVDALGAIGEKLGVEGMFDTLNNSEEEE